MAEKVLLVFKSTRDVIVSERECKKSGFSCIAVPTPREHSSQCGIALEVPSEQKEKVFELLKNMGKQFKLFKIGTRTNEGCQL